MAQTKFTIAEQAVDTRLLVGLLSKAGIGDEITYERLSTELGRPVSGNTSHLLSARKIVQRDFDIVFGTLHAVGIKRLSDAEIVATADDMNARVRRMAKRAVARIVKARDDHLSKDEIVQRNAAVSMAGVLMHIATKGALNKLESAVRVNAAELPVGKTLELFKA